MRLTLGGVPLHPALVHFPIAFWTAAPLADLAGWLGAGDNYWWLGRLCSIVGLALALPAIVAGLLDAIASRPEREVAAVIWRHAGLMAVAATCFALALLFGPAEQIANLSLHALGMISMLFGAHAGGRLAHVFGLPQSTPS